MDSLRDFLSARGGVAHRTLLANNGFGRGLIEHRLRVGELIRVRPGVFALHDAPSAVVRASRVGGRLAGVAAARYHRLWSPPGDRLVVEVSRSASRLRHPDDSSRLLPNDTDAVILWSSESRQLHKSVGVSPVLDVLRQCFLTLPLGHAVAIADSALRAHPIDRFDLEVLRLSLPPHLAPAIDLVDRRAESGTESIMRIELITCGHDCQIQVPIPLTDLDRLDILVGDRLVVECDSEAHHGGKAQRLRDLRRDTYLAALGFIVLRFDYQQVMFELDSVLAAVQTYVDLGLHLSGGRTRNPTRRG